jgi:protein O-GlcNAcase/histone acetyltransferase
VGGLLLNPNCEFALNFVPLRTFAAFVRSPGPWEPRTAYLAAMAEWLPHFATVREPVSLEDLVLLGDCYYLPFEEGAEAEVFFQRARALIPTGPEPEAEAAGSFLAQSTRLRELCTRLTELRNRPLFYALSRRIWELREELDLLERYVTSTGAGQASDAECRSDFHLPATYRGGFLPKLQRLLAQRADGSFTPSSVP